MDISVVDKRCFKTAMIPLNGLTYQHSWQSSEIYGDSMISLSAGGDSTCSIREDFTLWCWEGTMRPIRACVHTPRTLPARVNLPSDTTPLAVSVGGHTPVLWITLAQCTVGAQTIRAS